MLFRSPPSYFLADMISAEWNSFYVFGFLGIALLLFLSAVISASEVAFFSLKTNDLERCRESDDQGSMNIIELLKRPRLLLADHARLAATQHLTKVANQAHRRRQESRKAGI